MAASRGETYRKIFIPPLYGFPKQRNVDIPQTIPAEMWFVKVDDAYKENPEKLLIQTVPLELSVVPESTWVPIPSIGRNNPFYNYTGGEDSLEFTIDWYATSDNRQDVINSCRWLESLSKANGYENEPPRMLLIFGRLFKFTTWIIESAPYKLTLFDRESGMFPRQAYQDVVLKRVTDRNTGVNDIRFNV
jgi:hypothetical protein